MAITYPLALPTATGLARIKLRKHNVAAVNASPYTGEQQVYEHPGKWWLADIELPTLNRANAATWGAFLTKLNGPVGTFLMGDPLKVSPRGAVSGTPTVDGAHDARVTALAVATGENSVTGWMLEGDHIQIGSGSSARLHEVLNDADTDGSGNVTLDIWPPTRAALAGGEAIVYSSPKGLFRLTDRGVEEDRRPGPHTQIGFRAREAL